MSCSLRPANDASLRLVGIIKYRLKSWSRAVVVVAAIKSAHFLAVYFLSILPPLTRQSAAENADRAGNEHDSHSAHVKRAPITLPKEATRNGTPRNRSF
ncbi:hypothetical protein BV898_04515 [Hypsibius exemplaris]|uniref:Uncharacterized protein n=1 Tax=Hypsibius exemplaris TaxID=2072580 RepID=A0A1W0X2D8_HYPEX|nr:hypothetical protein BV898_04515 [Hypsibius exemplaris]